MKTSLKMNQRQGGWSGFTAVGRVVCLVVGLGMAVSLATGAEQAVVPQEPNTPSVRKHDYYIAQNPTTPEARQLWKSRITAAKDTNAGSSQEELQRLIGKLGAMELKPRVPAPQPQADALSLETEPNEPALDAETVQTAADQAENKLPDGAVSEQTLQVLSGQLQQPDLLKNPLQVADVLFNSGCLKEAAICYQEALDRLGTEGMDPLENKAWILLQLGNCLQQDDPQAALEKYSLVIVECSDSIWAELAKAKSDLIRWQLDDKPRALLKAPHL